MEYDPHNILPGLSEEIANLKVSAEHTTPLPVDKYIISSNLQKSVRYGQRDIAIRAAHALWQADRTSLYRRIHVIALEDCGVADTLTVIKVLTAYDNPGWRERLGDQRTAMFLAGMLADAVKSRAADELYLFAERDSTYRALRERLAAANDTELADNALNENALLPERALALWALAGTNKFPSEFMPKRRGSIEKTVKALKALNVPAALTEPCIRVLTRTGWPLALFTPLIWQEVQRDTPSVVEWQEPPSLSAVGGVLCASLDTFTRSGQSCYREWREAVPALKRFSVKQIGLAQFYEEGGLTNKTLTSQRLTDLRYASELAMMQSTRLDAPEYLGLQSLLAKHREVLQAIRRERLSRLLEPAA